MDRVVLAPKTGVNRSVGMLKNDKITYATTYASVLVQLTSVSSSIVFACFTFCEFLRNEFFKINIKQKRF